MNQKIAEFQKQYLKKGLPEINPGDTVKVYQKVREGGKERLQAFEGLVIKTKGGKGVGANFTVRKISFGGVGVERTFPMHSPLVSKIKVLKRSKVRRAKLYYIRERFGKKAKMKAAELLGETHWEEEKVETSKEEKEVTKEQAETKEETKKEKPQEEKVDKEEKKAEKAEEVKKDDNKKDTKQEDKKEPESKKDTTPKK